MATRKLIGGNEPKKGKRHERKGGKSGGAKDGEKGHKKAKAKPEKAKKLAAAAGKAKKGEEVSFPIEAWREVQAQRTKVRKLEAEEAVSKAAHSTIKKTLEEANVTLGRMIDDINTGQGTLPFDSAKKAAGGDKPADTPPANEDWRKEPISVLKLPGKIEEQLAEKNIKTIGDLADWTKDGYKKLTDVPGIGTGKAEKIEEALTQFWASRKVEPGPAEPDVVTKSMIAAMAVDPPAPAPSDPAAKPPKWHSRKLSTIEGLREQAVEALGREKRKTLGKMIELFKIKGNTYESYLLHIGLVQEDIDAIGRAIYEEQGKAEAAATTGETRDTDKDAADNDGEKGGDSDGGSEG